MAELQGEVEVEEVVGDELVSLTPAECQPAGTTGFVVVAAVMAALGGVLFGYDIGIVSGALLQLKQDFDLSCRQQEMVVSLLLVGALIGALCGGFFVDWIGRRWAIILNSLIFITGAVLLTIAPVYEVLIIGRLIVGFAVSLSAIAECIYISEIAPVNHRGRLVCVNEIGITVGLLLAYLVNYFLISVPSGWRYMFGLSVFPALVQGVGMLFLPPSPRFLMQKGKETQARTVLQKLRGTELIEGELSNIRNSLLTEHDYKVCDVLSSVDNMRGRFLIGVGLVFFQQFTGQTNVLYYAPTIFQSLGFGSDTAATLATVGLGFVKVVTTSICLCCVDKAGRRHFLLVGAGIMTVIIITLGIVAQFSLPVEATRPCVTHNATNAQGTIAIQTLQGNASLDKNSAETLYSDQFALVSLGRIRREAVMRVMHRNKRNASSAEFTEYGVSNMQDTSEKSTGNTIFIGTWLKVSTRSESSDSHTYPGLDIMAGKPLASLPEHVVGPTRLYVNKHFKLPASRKTHPYSSQVYLSFHKNGKPNFEHPKKIPKHFAEEFNQKRTTTRPIGVIYKFIKAQSRFSNLNSDKIVQDNKPKGDYPMHKRDMGSWEGWMRVRRSLNQVPPADQTTITSTLASSFPDATTSLESVENVLHTVATTKKTPRKEISSATDRLTQRATQTPTDPYVDHPQSTSEQSLLLTTLLSSDEDTYGISTTTTSFNQSDITTRGMMGNLMMSNSTEGPSETKPGIAQIVAFISLMLYVGAYSYGFGPVTWLVLSEIFPVGIRGRASSLATVFNWGTNVLMSLTFLDVMNGIGPSWTFLIYGLICSLSFLFIYCIVPETKNRSLEQISAELKTKSTLTGLSGHCCLRRVGACSSCCLGNSHQRLPQTDSYNDIQSAVDDEMNLVTTENSIM